MIALSIPHIPGLPLLSVSHTIRSESRPILTSSLRTLTRTPPRLITTYSTLSTILHSPFWQMLHQMLQKLVGPRSDRSRRVDGSHWTADEVYNAYITPCVIKTPRPRTKVLARKLYTFDTAQRRLFKRFLRGAQRYYGYLRDIGVRKREVGRVEVQVLLAGSVGVGHGNWAVGFGYGELETRRLRVQFLGLEEEVWSEGREGELRRKGLVNLKRHCTHEEEEGDERWRPIGEAVSEEVWMRAWSSRTLEQYLIQS